MTLIERIIHAAESDGSITSLLRMMKTLASRTGARELGKWADAELMGYPVEVTVPKYRGPFDMQVEATFHDLYGHRQQASMDTLRFPEDVRDQLFRYSFREPIAEVQAYLEDKKPTNIVWTADTVLLYNRSVKVGDIRPVMVTGWEMESAAGYIPRSRIAGVVDQVRTTAHSLALDLEQSTPTAGEPGTSAETNAKAAITITNNFDFSNANLSGSNNAINSSNFSQNITMPEKGDRAALERALREAGVSETEIVRLRSAIDADPTDPQNGLGSRVLGWLQERGEAILSAGATVVTQAVCAYYGIPIEA